jgi:tRNA splicing endonuclease
VKKGGKSDPELTDSAVIIRDKPLILLLRNIGAAVEEGAEAKIPLIEAAYFAEKRKLPFTKEEILALALKTDPLANEKYAVIDHLRSRGYITRVSLDTTEFLRLHRKGFRPGEDRTYYLVKVVPEGWKPDMREIEDALDFAGRLRKELVIAVVRGGRPRFIKMGRANFE